jgi:integrase
MKRSPHSFNVTVGICRIRIGRCHTRRGGRVFRSWRFRYRDENGQWRWLRRANKEIARAEAEAIATRAAASAGFAFSPEETAQFRAVRQNLADLDVTPEVASFQFRKARERLATIGRESIEEAVEFFLSHHHAGIADKNLVDVVNELVHVRERDGAGRRHLKDLASHLGRFARDMPRRLPELSGLVIDRWLAGLDVSNRSRRNYRGSLTNLFKFARDRGYVPDSFNPMKGVPLPKVTKRQPGVFRPDEMRKLLESCPEKLLPVVAIGAFAGLRQSEVMALDWGDVDWEGGRIRVPELARSGERTKTGSRWAVLHPNLREWLEPLRGLGSIVRLGENGVSKAIQRLVMKVNRELGRLSSRWTVKWVHNGCRHSYASYRCAVVRDVSLVSDEMGHSISELSRHYRNQTVTTEEAKEWFALRPDRSILYLPGLKVV